MKRALFALACAVGFVGSSHATLIAAQHYVFLDYSTSSPLTSPDDQRFVDNVSQNVAATITSNAVIGDRLNIVRIGDRAPRTVAPQVVPITRANRPREVALAVARSVHLIPSQTGEYHDETSMLWALQTIPVQCTPRSFVFIASDGLATDGGVNMRGILAGHAQFPAPPRRFLTGCAVVIHGLGITAGTQRPLAASEIAALEAAWRAYLQAAGAEPQSITIRNF